MKAPFIVLAAQRSGTHLLGTLLASHPELKMYGDLCNKGGDSPLPRNKDIDKLGPGEGCILMYADVCYTLQDVGFLSKYLVVELKRRDEDAHGKSFVRMQGKIQNKMDISIHTLRGDRKPIVLPEPQEHHVAFAKQSIRDERNAAAAKLASFFPFYPFEVFYEDITEGGKDVEEVKNDITNQLLVYLGVEPRTLKTTLAKNRYTTKCE